MKRFAAITLIILAVIAIASTLGWHYFINHFSLFGHCERDRVVEMNSPANEFIASEFRLNCGATSDWETIVELKNLASGDSQNVLVLKGDLVDICKMHWADEHLLSITCSTYGSEVYNKNSSFEDVTITFK